jgi:hypothetical protein
MLKVVLQASKMIPGVLRRLVTINAGAVNEKKALGFWQSPRALGGTETVDRHRVD